MVKEEGKANNLIELISKDKAFAAVHNKLNDILDAKNFIGRAPQQTEEFISAEIDPILQKHSDLLGAEGVVKV